MREKRSRRRHGYPDEKTYREEMRERDRIRQAYYLSLSEPVHEEPEMEETEPTQKLYYTRIRTRGWFDVIGPGGDQINDAAKRLPEAEAMAKELNDGLDG